jgi:hypothetical protein
VGMRAPLRLPELEHRGIVAESARSRHEDATPSSLRCLT